METVRAYLNPSSGALRKYADRKRVSFNEEVATRVFHADESETVFEDTDEEEDWEDDDELNWPPSFNEKEIFQRVDSKPNLHSSLLTSMMCEDGAAAVRNAASHSSQTVCRSRHMSSPQRVPQSANSLPQALSPRTTRLLMLSDELPESLRKHLHWERQDKKSTINAALKRNNTAPSESQPITSLTQVQLQRVTSYNSYFVPDHLEYHHKGW